MTQPTSLKDKPRIFTQADQRICPLGWTVVQAQVRGPGIIAGGASQPVNIAPVCPEDGSGTQAGCRLWVNGECGLIAGMRGLAALAGVGTPQ